jgi:fumarate reductase subunit D
MKIQEKQKQCSRNRIIQGLFNLGSTWAAIFVPVVIIIMGFIIPLGDAKTRSYILKLANTDFGKVFLLLMISLPIWYGLKQILTILHHFKISPKRENFLAYGIALAWTLHAIYILFVRV